MSPSPTRPIPGESLDQHAAAWKAIMQQVRAGSSWSGRERNCAFLNCGIDPAGKLRRFANVSALSGLDFTDDGRALATVDWDGDGDLDIWLRNRTAPRLRLMINQSDRKSKSIAVSLEGTSCNRDAIGATVELKWKAVPSGERLIDVVTAGNGFLSQSSKRLHFGVGEIESDARFDAVVTWPGGASETFTGLRPGRHYKLRQGTEKSQALAKRNAVQFGDVTYPQKATSAGARIVMPLPIPFPVLDLTTEQNLLKPSDKPILLVFWSASCPNCRAELFEISAAKKRFETNRLEVVAVCLDEVSGSATRTEDAEAVAAEIGFPFPSTTTSLRSANVMKGFLNSLFDNHSDVVVPLNFLLDQQRRVVAIYRGGFSTDIMLRDLRLIELSDSKRRDEATPFEGRWFTKPATGREINQMIERRLRERFPQEAKQYAPRD